MITRRFLVVLTPIVLSLAYITGVGAQGPGGHGPGSGNLPSPAQTAVSGHTGNGSGGTPGPSVGSTIAAIAQGTCTATNSHVQLPTAAAASAQTAISMPNHGQCVSAAAAQNSQNVAAGVDDSSNGNGTTISALAQSTCTAVNANAQPATPAATAALTAVAKPNHGQCVSAAASKNGKSHNKSKKHKKG